MAFLLRHGHYLAGCRTGGFFAALNRARTGGFFEVAVLIRRGHNLTISRTGGFFTGAFFVMAILARRGHYLTVRRTGDFFNARALTALANQMLSAFRPRASIAVNPCTAEI